VSSFADILHPQAAADGGGDGDEGELDFWIELPRGYFPLPMDDIDATLAATEANLTELTPEDKRPLLSAVIGTFTVLLEQLQERNTAYCGLGWHTTEDGEIVPSSLVISLQTFPERRNPRLVLKDMVEVRAEAGAHGQVDLVDLNPGPALFFESVLSLPKPRIPGQPADDAPGDAADKAKADVYQLQALVPSGDGTKLAAIDFSTPDIPHGPRFRAMMVLMANSVSFTAPPGSADAEGSHGTVGSLGTAGLSGNAAQGTGSTASSISQILGGLTP
jgi:hypothetical protein